MSAGEYCNRELIVVQKDEGVREAVKLMRSQHVGDVVVVEQRGAETVPLGIVTDRDIVVEILAREVDPDAVTLPDVMSRDLVMVTEDTKLMEAIKLMREKAVRRLLVVNEQGGLEGLLSVDDVLELIVEQMSDLAALASNQLANEAKLRK